MLADDRAREEIRVERRKNVVIDAGAGTGKTTIVVDRFLNLLAPPDGRDAAPIGQLAAITFTRRAAGELRYRIREKILVTLESGGLKNVRRDLLQAALTGLDNAFIGTIHSFADRLLKLRPTEAELSPAYGIEENTDELVSITFDRLRRAAEEHNLAAEAGINAGLARELEETVNDYVGAGYAIETTGGTFAQTLGLDSLVAAMIGSRDVRPNFRPPARPDFTEVSRMALKAAQSIRALKSESSGTGKLKRLALDLDRVATAKGEQAVLKAVRQLQRFNFADLQKKRDFADEKEGWELTKSLRDTTTPAIADPVSRWMCGRLVRLVPAICGIYEKIKREHEVVDQLDLLLKLRDVLGKEAHRTFYAGLFRHIFVDEFQDTDPVQADIIRLLVSEKAGGKPRHGSITIVGDAKQSIYRFRRADISAYEKFRGWLEKHGALTRSLTTNFRSAAPLVQYANARFQEMMGLVKDGRIFDSENGAVFYEPLAEFVPGKKAAVHLIPISAGDDVKLKAEIGRGIEAEAIARYLLHLKSSNFMIRDAETETERPMRWRDIAVLSLTTPCWRGIFAEFDRFGIPYAARGGSVFGSDPAIRAFILALRSIADPDDGPAIAQYYRPPFWILSMDDILGKTVPFQQAEKLLADLRMRRLSRPAVDTARDLLELTRCVSAVRGSPNGSQTLSKIQELLNILDADSRSGLDFDAVTLKLRAWIDHPPQQDAPEPVTGDVVRFTTVYQAKGLEYPVVVLANAFQSSARQNSKSWLVSNEGGRAEGVIRLAEVKGEVPRDAGLRDREKAFGDVEMTRLAYVAVTRARDLFILFQPSYGGSKSYLSQPLMTGDAKTVQTIEPFIIGRLPKWAKSAKEQPKFRPSPEVSTEMCEKKWAAGLATALRPEAAPRAITSLARRRVETDMDLAEELRKAKSAGRYGATFGIAVHRALQMLVSGASRPVQEIVFQCAQECGLTEHLPEAVADVERTWSELSKIPGDKIAEFPVSAPSAAGHLDIGYIDLLCIGPSEIWVLDFKTDTPPQGKSAKTSPMYVEQLRAYVGILNDSRIFTPRSIRAGLLYTATGEIVSM